MNFKRLTTRERMLVFRTLVEIQDTDTMTIGESKDYIAEKFSILKSQVLEIEDEGLNKEWPPLNEPPKVAAAAVQEAVQEPPTQTNGEPT